MAKEKELTAVVGDLSKKIEKLDDLIRTRPSERFSVSIADQQPENRRPSLGLVRGPSKYQQAMSVFGGTVLAACFFGLARTTNGSDSTVAGLELVELFVHVASRFSLGLALLGIAAFFTQLWYDEFSREENLWTCAFWHYWALIILPTVLGLFAYLWASIPFIAPIFGCLCTDNGFFGALC